MLHRLPCPLPSPWMAAMMAFTPLLHPSPPHLVLVSAEELQVRWLLPAWFAASILGSLERAFRWPLLQGEPSCDGWVGNQEARP